MVSVIIPNYNGENNLRENLPDLIDLLVKKGDVELIIVDDSSSDNSIDILENFKTHFKNKLNIKIIRKDKNTGFSSTVNKGVSEASGDKILLLNTDIKIKDDFIEPLLKDLTDEVFAVGSLNIVDENEKEIFEGRGVGEWKRGFLVHNAGEMNKNTTLWVSGGAGLFNKKIWGSLNGLDEIYDPFYWEDIDICYRALKNGYKLIFEKDSKVYHRHSEGSIRKKYSSFDIKKIAYRNQIIFAWKNGQSITVITNLFWLPYHLIKSITAGDFAFLAGLGGAILKIPKILNIRVKQKNQSKISDQSAIVKN